MFMQKTTVWLISILFSATTFSAAADTMLVGVAKVDITPDFPIRLAGYSSRKDEAREVAGRLWAKALAIGGDEGRGPLVLVTIDNCTVPTQGVSTVGSRLRSRAGVRRERFVVCATHTHSAPRLQKNRKQYWYSSTPEHQEHIARYTRQLGQWIEEVAFSALAARKPARLAWTQGSLDFAANRRVLRDGKWIGFGVNPDGPVDKNMPLLRVTDADGKLMAVLVNYACHCTTLGGKFNQIHGDWAGSAQKEIEADHPGAIAMVSIGCGADANPNPRGSLDDAAKHGRSVADEVNRLLLTKLISLDSLPRARDTLVKLPLATLPTRNEIVRRIETTDPDAKLGAHARDMLRLVDRDGKLPSSIEYRVTVWSFGDRLAMIFLPGEVVVDYSLRLKRELDGSRLWLTAYANDVPCYIASKRLLSEGGYEADQSMLFDGFPTRLSPKAEDRLLGGIRELVPPSFNRR